MKKDPPVDFCDTRTPWLSTSGSVEDPNIKIDRLVFFVWVWEPYYSVQVTGYHKDDKEGIDISIW